MYEHLRGPEWESLRKVKKNTDPLEQMNAELDRLQHMWECSELQRRRLSKAEQITICREVRSRVNALVARFNASRTR